MASRTKKNFVGAYLDDAMKKRLDQIRQAESARAGTTLTLNQTIEILINRFPLEKSEAHVKGTDEQ